VTACLPARTCLAATRAASSIAPWLALTAFMSFLGFLLHALLFAESLSGWKA
jgi:hypothetical protein